MSDDTKQIRIMTVDDHPVLRQGIATLISDQPDMTLVAEATNGREAIQQFRAHRPDVTLMDLQMPEMNGLDALIAIRGEFADARIIVLTTYTGDVQARRALQAALLINLYRDEPILHLPFRLLALLADIERNFTTWRQRHAQMAMRMIGTRIGTGGTSGHEYLDRAAERHKVFADLSALSSFFIPRSALPKLPPEVRSRMGFRFHSPR